MIELFFLPLLWAFQVSCLPADIVETKSGLLLGWEGLSRDGRVIQRWTNIPYAKPPVGELRFKDPQPYGKWQGVYRAIGDYPRCPELDDAYRMSYLPKEVVGTEDCLYLNIFRPKINNNSLPVLFYIHGGGFHAGEHLGPDVASFIMDEDVILVTMNYRLGALGFLSLEDEVIPGNFGCKDQALALKWVSENIASFGGNPKAIIILGESAGGISVQLNALSPLTRGLSRGAVIISGTVNIFPRILKTRGLARNSALTAAEFLDCNKGDSKNILECLQSVDIKKILNSENIFDFNPYVPIVEPPGKGAFMSTDPLELTDTKPWIVSFSWGDRVLRQSGYFDNPLAVSNYMKNLDDNIKLTLKETCLPLHLGDFIKARYFGGKNMDPLTQIGVLYEDHAFVYGALNAVNHHQGKNWIFHFEHRGKISQNSHPVNLPSHADELIYLLNMTTQFHEELRGADIQISKDFVKLFANFAIYLNPTPPDHQGGGNTVWKEWRANELLRVTSQGNVMAEPDFYRQFEDTYDFWESLYSRANGTCFS